MKVAIVGCGNVSKNHFAAIENIPSVQIVATVDIIAERAQEKADKYGARAYTDFDEMLANEKPECVHIATPHYLHTEMAIKALESGAHVFVEKPCSTSAEEADRLIEAMNRTGNQVGVCFQNRYNSSTITMKKLIDVELIGKMVALRAFVTWDRDADYYNDDWHGKKDKECGGVLINQAIHTVDLIQYLGGGCDSVTAHVFNDHLKGVIEVEDTATARLQLKNGVPAILYATTGYSADADVFIEAIMEKGTFRLEGERLIRINPNGFTEVLCEKSNRQFTGKSYWGHGHPAIIRDFYDSIKTNRKFEIDAAEGSKAPRIVAACYESSEKNIEIEVK